MIVGILHGDRKTWGPYIPFATNRNELHSVSKMIFPKAHRRKRQNPGLQVSSPLSHAFPPQGTKKKYDSPLQKILNTVIQQLFCGCLSN